MIPNTPGIYPGISRADYERIDAVNWSTLKEILRSPAHYRAELKRKKKVTDPMRIGSATHVLAFEPDQFFRRFAIWDGERRTGNDWKAFSRKCEAEGLEILTEKMHRKSKAMAEAATRDELCAAYLRGGQAEVTLVWWYEAPPGPDGEPGYRILCKGRPDVGADALVDLKTTKDGSPTEFGKSASRYLYTSQSAFYRHGYRTLTRKDLPCVLVAVESDEPHISQPYILTEAQLLRGESRFRTCLDQLHRCQQTNDWRGYADRPITLELPTWDAPEDDDGDLSALGLEGVEEAA